MSLFIVRQNRGGDVWSWEVSEAYVMALTFLVFFAVGKIFRAVIKNQIKKNKNRNKKNIEIVNARGGGGSLLEFNNNEELAEMILVCIEDNKSYLVNDPDIIKLIFALVKAKIKKESIVLTPNLIRYLAWRLVNDDKTLFLKIRNIFLFSESQARISFRVIGTAFIAFIGAVFNMLPYSILIALTYFDTTENCYHRCSDYFHELPAEGPVKIQREKSTGNIFISANDDARQIEIYIPSKAPEEVTMNEKGELIKTYQFSRKKPRQVNFSDFRKKDKDLSIFKDQDLKEPSVPQRTCELREAMESD